MTAMAYSSTNLAAFAAAVADQYAPWYPVSTIQNLLNVLRQVNFSTQASRSLGLGALTSLVSVAPYAISDGSAERPTDLRFSTTTNTGTISVVRTYVAAFCDSWPEALQQANTALQFRDRSSEVTLLENASSSGQASKSTPDPMQSRQQYNDSSQAFRWAISAMTSNIRNGVGIYNVASFEDKYSLVWGTPQAASPKHVTPGPNACDPTHNLTLSFGGKLIAFPASLLPYYLKYVYDNPEPKVQLRAQTDPSAPSPDNSRRTDDPVSAPIFDPSAPSAPII